MQASRPTISSTRHPTNNIAEYLIWHSRQRYTRHNKGRSWAKRESRRDIRRDGKDVLRGEMAFALDRVNELKLEQTAEKVVAAREEVASRRAEMHLAHSAKVVPVVIKGRWLMETGGWTKAHKVAIAA